MTTFLITQATGQQAQWTMSNLLAAGRKVHAVVRDLDKVPEALKRPGVTLFQGESKNFDDIFKAAQGCDAAYLNTYPWPGLEEVQAQTIVDACKKAGIKHIVALTTTMTGDKAMTDDELTAKSGLKPYFDAKRKVENCVRGGKFETYTILRPGVLIQDFLQPGVMKNFPGLPSGELDHSLEDGATMPFTDAYDVGKYAAAALQDPTTFGNQEIELNNESLTSEQMHEILVRVSGKNLRLKKRTPEEVEAAKLTLYGQPFQLWANERDFSAYTAAAKDVQAKFGIPYTSMEAGLTREKVRLLECLGI